MTVSQVIVQTQAVRPDLYTNEQITEWLADVDGQLAAELLHTEPVRYSYPSDSERELLVPFPYDRLYHLYVIAMIDFYNRETDLYANDMEAYNNAMEDYRKYYRRTNRPSADGHWFKTM